MKRNILIVITAVLLIAGCKNNVDITETPFEVSYSGQYQNVFYNDGTSEPEVTLVVLQDESELSGVGFFNGISFNFKGSLNNNHGVLKFDLLNTNYGDIKGCYIDGFFGADNSFSGGYTLSPEFGTQKIRFKYVGQVKY